MILHRGKRLRNYIFDTIKSVFRLYGFQQIETPAMENLTTLMGKYGEEGDKLLFKILNSGDFLSGISEEELKEANSLQFSGKIAKKVCVTTSPCRLPGLWYKIATEFLSLSRDIRSNPCGVPTVRKKAVSRVLSM